MDKLSVPLIDYQLVLKNFNINQIEVQLYSLKNLDETIDQLCQSLEHQPQYDPLSEDLCPYFAQIWNSALALSRFITENQNLIAHQKILEIGCGLALPSFIATHLGAEITATDFHQDVEWLLNINQKMNNCYFKYQRINWRDQSFDHKYDLIIGSDILYESRHPKEIAQTLFNLTTQSGKIILSDPGRSYLQNFANEMKKLKLEYKMHQYKIENDEIFILVFEKGVNH